MNANTDGQPSKLVKLPSAKLALFRYFDGVAIGSTMMTMKERLQECSKNDQREIHNTRHTFSKMYNLCSLAKNLVPRLTRMACDNTNAAYMP